MYRKCGGGVLEGIERSEVNMHVWFLDHATRHWTQKIGTSVNVGSCLVAVRVVAVLSFVSLRIASASDFSIEAIRPLDET